MCIAGKSLQYSYCDYWLYGGVQAPSAELLKKSKKYQERTLFNLTSIPKTFKSLKFEKDRVAEPNKAKAKETVPENQKRSDCLGHNAERKIGNKRREDEQREKVPRDNKRCENGRREREWRDAAQHENERRRNDRQRDEERHRNDCRREEDRRRTDYNRGVRRY